MRSYLYLYFSKHNLNFFHYFTFIPCRYCGDTCRTIGQKPSSELNLRIYLFQIQEAHPPLICNLTFHQSNQASIHPFVEELSICPSISSHTMGISRTSDLATAIVYHLCYVRAQNVCTQCIAPQAKLQFAIDKERVECHFHLPSYIKLCYAFYIVLALATTTTLQLQ